MVEDDHNNNQVNEEVADLISRLNVCHIFTEAYHKVSDDDQKALIHKFKVSSPFTLEWSLVDVVGYHVEATEKVDVPAEDNILVQEDGDKDD